MNPELPARSPNVGSQTSREISAAGGSYPAGYHPLLIGIDQQILEAESPEERRTLLVDRREITLQLQMEEELRQRRTLTVREFDFKTQMARIVFAVGVLGIAVGAGYPGGMPVLADAGLFAFGAALFSMVPDYVTIVLSKVPGIDFPWKRS